MNTRGRTFVMTRLIFLALNCAYVGSIIYSPIHKITDPLHRARRAHARAQVDYCAIRAAVGTTET